MFDESIRHAHTPYIRRITMISHKLKDRATQSASRHTILHGDNPTVPATNLVQQFLVEWL